MKNTVLLLFIALSFAAFGQRYEYVYRNAKDHTINCYLKIYPKTDSIKGLIVRDFTTLPDSSKKSPYRFVDLASEAGMMTLITSTSTYFPELYTSDAPMNMLDEMIHEVLEEHNIPKNKVFIGGISASGARALRFAQYCARGASDLKIRGVFVVDSPLDLERFYTSASQHKANFTDGMLWEAEHMIPLFDSLFRGGPDEHLEDYRNASVFSHTDPKGGNAHLLKNTDILIFHEPDIDWWITERGCSYYDINSYDLVAFTVFLRSLGNENVDMISTTGKGFNRQGERKPHSWSIVDEGYLMQWILARVH